MKQPLSPLLVLSAIFLFCCPSLSAVSCPSTTNSITLSSITATWKSVTAPAGCATGLPASNQLNYSYRTPQGLTTTVVGGGYKYFATNPGNIYYLSDSSTTSFNGWHGFQGFTGTAQNYLTNNLYICSTNCATNPGVTNPLVKGLSITLGGSASLQIGSSPASYAHPTSDNGYFLSTPDLSSITITFGSLTTTGTNKCPGCINDLAFYWGSIDAGNEITFKDWNDVTTTFYGSSFYSSFGSNGNPLTNQNNVASYGFEFNTTTAWKSVTFRSCDYTPGTLAPDCSRGRAAFEFDDLQWKYPGTCCGPISNPGNTSAPVPEPAELPVLGLSLAALLGWVKGKANVAKN